MANEKILIADDDRNICELLRLYLEKENYTVVLAGNGEEALAKFASENPDLILLDIMMPMLDGWQVCREIRKKSDCPIIMITAKGETFDKVLGLELGADDYVVKPFNPRELALRAQAIVRRSRTGKSSQLIRNGPLVIDVSSGKVTLNSTAIKLTDIELRLLIALGRKIDQTVNWRDLLTQVWETESQLGGKEMLKTAVYRLRSRLGDSGDQIIASVRGVGYTMTKVESLPGELS